MTGCTHANTHFNGTDMTEEGGIQFQIGYPLHVDLTKMNQIYLHLYLFNVNFVYPNYLNCIKCHLEFITTSNDVMMSLFQQVNDYFMKNDSFNDDPIQILSIKLSNRIDPHQPKIITNSHYVRLM